jgi:hypothetical protein
LRFIIPQKAVLTSFWRPPGLRRLR